MEQLVNDLIKYFLDEANHPVIDVPVNYIHKREFLRGLINVREAKPLPSYIIDKENELLKLELKEKNIIDIDSFSDKFTIWQGDITTIKCDAIVNLANPNLLGCFKPNHNCIDNKVHTYAGISLRLKCKEIVKGNTIEVGKVILTSGYNLPCKYIIHAVKPIIVDRITDELKQSINDFYINSFEIAKKNNIKTICIPNLFSETEKVKIEIAKITVDCIKEYLKNDDYFEKVVFNVFTLDKYDIYSNLFK